MTRVDRDSGHGGADFVNDDVPATAVGKMTKQEWIKHHSIKTKLYGQQARATAHRMTLAAVKRTFG